MKGGVNRLIAGAGIGCCLAILVGLYVRSVNDPTRADADRSSNSWDCSRFARHDFAIPHNVEIQPCSSLYSSRQGGFNYKTWIDRPGPDVFKALKAFCPNIVKIQKEGGNYR